MVKNITGGNKSKGQARKLQSAPRSAVLRVSQDDCEMYAMMVKNMGSGIVHVLCSDGITRLCHIRGKFRGRGKRDNIIRVGSLVLVGLREWELDNQSSKKMKNCDLLEVYDDQDKQKLKSSETHIDWSIFASSEASEKEKEEVVTFMDQTTQDYESLIQKEADMLKTGKTITTIVFDNEEIDVDDI